MTRCLTGPKRQWGVVYYFIFFMFFVRHVVRAQPLLLDRTPTADGYLAVKLFITGFVRPSLLSMLRTPRPGGETRADAVALGPLESSRS